MSDPKNIKDQSTIKSTNVTPSDAADSVDQIKDEDLGKVTGGSGLKVGLEAPYADCL